MVLRILSQILMLSIGLVGCDNAETDKTNSSSTRGSSTSSGNRDVVVTGQIAIESESEVDDDLLLGGRDVNIVDSEGKSVVKTITESDGSYVATVPGALVIDRTSGDGLALQEKSLAVRTVIPETASGNVVGVDDSIDLSLGSFVEMGLQPLKKITAIRGRVFMDGARDHTGIVVYVPGTSLQARTDSSGLYVMAFVAAGTYNLRMEKDGYLPKDIANVIASEGETTSVEGSVLKLSGGTSTFSVKQVGDAGLSQSRVVEFLISSGDADRFKAGLSSEVANVAYDQVPEIYRHEFETDGVFELSFVFANADGFESTVNRTVEVDTTKPQASGLSLADRSSLSTGFSNERYVIAFHPDCIDIDKVAVVAGTAGQSPALEDFVFDCFTSGSDSNANFQLPATEGSFSYTLWVKDRVGNISESGVSGEIVFGETPPAALTMVLSDQTSGSSLGTDITTVDVTIDSCSDTAKVLVSESQLLPPAPEQFSSACTTAPKAYSYTFANNIAGSKTVLIWAIDPAGNVGQVSGSATMVLDQSPLDSPPSFTILDPTPATPTTGTLR